MPEHNLIQRPDLLHRVQQFLGLRQAHVAPSLTEGVQLVCIIGDIRDELVAGKSAGGASSDLAFSIPFNMPAGGAGVFNTIKLRNPSGNQSGRVIQLQDLIITAGTDVTAVVEFDTGAFAAGFFEPPTDRTLDNFLTSVTPPVAIGEFTTQAGAQVGVVNPSFRIVNNFATPNQVFDLRRYLFPQNYQFVLRSETANLTLQGTLSWIERTTTRV
jgi:hypothetical protein